MCSEVIFHKYFLLYICQVKLPHPQEVGYTVRHFTLQIAHRNVYLIDLAAYCKTAASLSGWKRAKYVVCEMAQNPLEVSMEVPIIGIKYLVPAPISALFLHTQAPPAG